MLTPTFYIHRMAPPLLSPRRGSSGWVGRLRGAAMFMIENQNARAQPTIFKKMGLFGARWVLSRVRWFTTSSFLASTALALHPNWITGFSDAESCFYVGVCKNLKIRLGWEVQATLKISLHEKDRALLGMIQSSLGVGKIYKLGAESIIYKVGDGQDLLEIIAHFDKYPLFP